MSFASSFLVRAAALVLCLGGVAAHAAPVTLQIKASGFQNAGTPYPGLDGEIDALMSWDAVNKADPISALLSIDLEIAGHHYTLDEVGIANNGATQTAIGALVRGANAVVGDGVFDDFLIVFDRVNPSVNAFAYSIQGKSGAIWWTPAFSTAAYVEDQTVPEPASLALVALPLAWLVARRRIKG